jgi:hypothetical protein
MTSLLILMLTAAMELSPIPREYQIDDRDVFRVHPGLKVVVADDADAALLAEAATLFDAIGYRLPVVRAAGFDIGDEAIYLGHAGSRGIFEKRKFRKIAETAAEYGAEGYRLVITEKYVVAAGADAAGLFRAMQTLRKIAAAPEAGWPCLEIGDWPALDVRGITARGLLTTDQLRLLAERACNWILFDSIDFCELEGVRAEAWKRAFNDARQLGMEPVPALRILDNAGILLRKNPAAAEGRTSTEAITLHGDDWAKLAHYNIIRTKESPIDVSISGVHCRERMDYLIEPGDLKTPFTELNGPWLIRRIPGGRIPDGATVTVTCSYAPPDTDTLCPHAPETEALIRETLGRIHELLHPAFLYIGNERPGRLNRDFRCLRGGKPDAEIFLDAVGLMHSLAEEIDPRLRLIMSADSLLTAGPEPDSGLGPARNRLPQDMVLLATLPPHAGTDNAGVPRRMDALGHAWIGLTGHGDAEAFTAAEIAVASGKAAGIAVPRDTDRQRRFYIAMEKAWSPESPMPAWPAGLNTFFESSLWDPLYDQRRDTIAEWLNRRIVSGGDPENLLKQFRDFLDPLRKKLPEDHRELEATERLLEQMAEYLRLEAAYAEDPGDGLPRGLEKLVENQAGLDPAFTPERRKRILSTIENENLFVPASILFERQLLYYRPAAKTPHPVYELPVTPEYTDTEGKAEALLDFGGLAAPVCRIDYETVAAARVSLERSTGGSRYDTVKTWQAQKGGVRGPALPDAPLLSPILRLSAESRSGRAVLREIRVFARKEPARAVCAWTMETPALEQQDAGAAWPATPQAAGFLRINEETFAEAPTEVRICRNRSHLFIGITACEPRMHAMISDMRGSDQPLWEQESVEVVIAPPGAGPWRLAVNPAGERYDAEGVAGGSWDKGWDGAWEVMTDTREDRWVAVFAIPFTMTGGAPQRDAEWQVNFLRHRANVKKEDSAWAVEYPARSGIETGILNFR